MFRINDAAYNLIDEAYEETKPMQPGEALEAAIQGLCGYTEKEIGRGLMAFFAEVDFAVSSYQARTISGFLELVLKEIEKRQVKVEALPNA